MPVRTFDWITLWTRNGHLHRIPMELISIFDVSAFYVPSDRQYRPLPTSELPHPSTKLTTSTLRITHMKICSKDDPGIISTFLEFPIRNLQQVFQILGLVSTVHCYGLHNASLHVTRSFQTTLSSTPKCQILTGTVNSQSVVQTIVAPRQQLIVTVASDTLKTHILLQTTSAHCTNPKQSSIPTTSPTLPLPIPLLRKFPHGMLARWPEKRAEATQWRNGPRRTRRQSVVQTTVAPPQQQQRPASFHFNCRIEHAQDAHSLTNNMRVQHKS